MDSTGQVTFLTETLSPSSTSLSWTLRVASSSGTYSKGIWTRLSGWTDAHTRKFWTTWSNMDTAAPPSVPWQDPLSPAPFSDQTWQYGSQGSAGFSVPLATVIEPDTNHGVTLVQSPDDTLLNAVINTTAGGDVSFGRFFNRITSTKPVTFHMDLVPTAADWRPVLGWVTQQYPSYFQPVMNVTDTSGLGSYSPFPGPFTDALRSKLQAEDYRTDWHLDGGWPYEGEFIPPVSSASQQWEPSLATYWPPSARATSISSERKELDYWQDAGVANMAYFNAWQFGRQIQQPFPAPRYSCSDPNLWKNPNDYLRCDFQNALVRGPNGAADVAGWRGAAEMDPGDPSYAQHLLDQARSLLTTYPEYSGLVVDEMSFTRSYNYSADDGVSWVNGKPARSGFVSWKNDFSPKLTALVHGMGRQVWGNSFFINRVDLFKNLDGIFAETDASSGEMNLDAFLGLQRPVVDWVYGIGSDPDSLLQHDLYMGVYPMADAPQNDHGIHTSSPTLEQAYADYGPLFKALTGKKWVYTPHAVEVTSGNALANEFSVDDGVVLPVIGGGSATQASLLLHGLQQAHPGLDLSQAEYLQPGQSTWQPIPVSQHGADVTTTVPLARGAAMVRFLATQNAAAPAGPPVSVALSSSASSASADHPATLTAVVRNLTQHTVTGVTSAFEVPGGWTATPITATPATLSGGVTAKIRWSVSADAAIAGSVGELRVKVKYGVGTASGQVSDATRVTAGDLVPDGVLTATGSSELTGYPAQSAVDGNQQSFWTTSPTIQSASIETPSLTIDLHRTYHLAGLTYLPRQDGNVDGWIRNYTISTSTDGVTFTPVARGQWQWDAGLQAAMFNAPSVRYVRLTNDTTLCPTTSGSVPTSAAEIGLVVAPEGASPVASSPPAAAQPFAHLVPHSGMSATADNQQAGGFEASNAIDGSTCTIWHIQFSPYKPPPASITLDLGKSYDTTGLSYLPRQDFDDAQIMGYQVSVSSDGVSFTPIAQGTWNPDASQYDTPSGPFDPAARVVHWAPTTARFVRLTAITGFSGELNDFHLIFPQGLVAAADLEVGYN